MGINHNFVRNAAVAILSDDAGISIASFEALIELLTRSANEDLIEAVVEAGGRIYLPSTSPLHNSR